MMGSYIEEKEEQFFDTREEISSVSDWSSDCSENCSSVVGSASSSLQYEVWTRNPESVLDRRRRFLEWMGLSSDRHGNDSEDVSFDDVKIETDRITENSGAVLRTSGFEDEFLSSQSLMSNHSNGDQEKTFEYGVLEDRFATSKNSNDGTEFLVDGMGQDGEHSRLVSFQDFQRTLGSSPGRQLVNEKRKERIGWLRKLGVAACIVDREGAAAAALSKLSDLESTVNADARRRKVKVNPYKKRTKELSSLYAGQEFVAHQGSILTMKFSLDGQYLASGGEDGIVRVWKVIEDEGLNKFETPDIDPSCLYFSMNNLSKISPLHTDKEKMDKIKKVRRSSESTFAVFPPKVFRILEKPLHEFHGHNGEVLNLSWSKKGFLLSSSTDKTVRLWQVGHNRCLRVFSHNNYVTCVDFNPVDDNYFISGSIDGKVRIWEVLRCHVVDYIDIREIVTAVCYHPDGKGGIVGSMTGNCLFYDIIDNQLQLDAQVCLQGKKKLPCKRITGFQFCPIDPNKVLVTSADSFIRLLCGRDVVCKFRASGLRIAGSQMSASFTCDGKHIVSASEDSNVYIWNHSSHDKTSSRAKSIWSCESFPSHNVSIAIPWWGIGNASQTLSSPSSFSLENEQKHQNINGELDPKLHHSSPDCFSLMRGFLSESLTKGSATWPEEELVSTSPMAASPTTRSKAEYKLLKSACQSMFGSPHMWGLVITSAGWDGSIRTYFNYGLPIRL